MYLVPKALILYVFYWQRPESSKQGLKIPKFDGGDLTFRRFLDTNSKRKIREFYLCVFFETYILLNLKNYSYLLKFSKKEGFINK